MEGFRWRFLPAVVLCAVLLAGCVGREEAGSGDRQVSRPSSAAAPVVAAPDRGMAAATAAEVEGCRLSSLVWSPDGRTLAFVAARRGSDGDAEMRGPDAADVFLLRDGRLRRLLRSERKVSGIPVGLFWLSDEELGWAGCMRYESCVFFSAKVSDPKPRRLIATAFGVGSSRSYADVDAPDDLAYDARTGDLAFTGNMNARDQLTSSVLFTYNLRSKSLVVEPFAPAVEGEVTFGGLAPNYYVAARVRRDGESEYLLWQEPRPPFDGSGVIARGVLFPRLSPDGRRLMWMDGDRDTDLWEIVMYDLSTKVRRVVARDIKGWDGMNPAVGCPFAWSPSGDRVAFADGSRIRFVEVRR